MQLNHLQMIVQLKMLACFMQHACNHQDRWVKPASANLTGSVLKAGASSLTTPCDLSWDELSCSVLDSATHRQKDVLQSNAGSALPGEVVALVGPSGAGTQIVMHVQEAIL